MSFTFPTAYSNALNHPFKENWIVKIFYDSDPDSNPNNCLKVSYESTTVDSQNYTGVILNKLSIRESIDLAKSIAKTSNVSITLANVNVDGTKVSAELFGGSNKYINKTVRIYSQLNDESTLANCLQIYEGRLIDIEHDDLTVQISVVSKRPWDYITIPQDKTTSGNKYIPVSYGDFTRNTQTDWNSPQFLSTLSVKTYRPIPLNYTKEDKFYWIDGKSGSTNAHPAIYDKNVEKFIPLTDGSTSTTTEDGSELSNSPTDLKRAFYIRPRSHTEVALGIGIMATNLSNVYDTDTNKYASISFDEAAADFNASAKYEFKIDDLTGNSDNDWRIATTNGGVLSILDEDLTTAETGVNVKDGTAFSVDDLIKIGDELMLVTAVSSNTLTVTRGYGDSIAVTHNQGAPIFIDHGKNISYLKYEIIITNISGDLSCVNVDFYTPAGNLQSGKITTSVSAKTVNVVDITGTNSLSVVVKFTVGDTVGTGDLTAEVRLYDIYQKVQRTQKGNNQVKIIYTASDGNVKSYPTGSGLARYIHEAHRDLLYRFTGWNDTDANIDGWSTLNTDRTGWNIRWWTLNQVELSRILQQFQYEGCFIFRFRSDGSGQYIHIVDTPTVEHTLTKYDIRNMKISITPWTELITKMEIDYERHPAENRYISSATHTNSTARTNWNIGSNENIKNVKLDALVANVTGGSGHNGSFGNYYDNIFGDIKTLVSMDIVNPSFYNVEVGDIIGFSDMLVNPFGESWSGKTYIIVSTIRKLGSVQVTAKEV